MSSDEVRRIERSLRAARITLEKQKIRVVELEKRLEKAKKKKERSVGYQVKKRIAFTKEEDRRMWIFLKKEMEEELQNRRTRIGILNPNGLATWRDFRMDTKSQHSAQSINSHFRRFLRPKINEAPFSRSEALIISMYFHWDV